MTSPHRLLISDDTADRMAALGTWLQQRSGSAHQEVLVVAPRRGAADDLLRRACPAAGLFGVHRTTLQQLAAELAAERLASRGLAPVSGLGSEALAARCLARCRQAAQLRYFLPVAEAPGLPKALRRTLAELRLGQIDADALAASGAPGEDLAHLLAAYEEELERWHLADDASLLQLATRRAEDGDHRVSTLSMVWLDISPRYGLEQRFLAALAGTSPAIVAGLPGGDGPGQEALAAILQAEPEPLAGEGDRMLDRLRRRIFRPGLEHLDPPADDAYRQDDHGSDDQRSDDHGSDDQRRNEQSVVLFSAPGEGRECVEIARHIHRLASAGIAFDQMAILLRDPHSYLPLVEEALRRADIPGYFTRGTTRPHSAGRAFLALLTCAAENLSASRFSEYLSLGQVPADGDRSASEPQVEIPWVLQDGDQMVFKSMLPWEEVKALQEVDGDGHRAATEEQDDEASPVIAGTLQTPRHWEHLLVNAAVLGGSERWRRRLDGYRNELRLQLEGLDTEDATRRQKLRRRIERLGHLESFALPIIDRLAALPTSASWGDWLETLEALAQRTLRQPEKVLALLAELRPMEHVGPVGLDEVRQVLEERLTLLRAEPPSRRYARIFVATIDEARGRSFEVVFLPGLAEGIFPRRTSEDPLLLDVYRQALNSQLMTQRQRIDEERLLLRIAAGAARRQLLVSYPNLDTLQGRSRVPSFYALDLLRAAEGTLPDVRHLEERASSNTASILGWPAPQDADLAIDEAEFDLAVIEPLLRLPAEEARARGRYLLESNRHLTRSLRRRYRRWKGRLNSADGIAQADSATLEALAPHRLRQRSYSPTALQHFAACPYRFLLSAVHGLRPRDAVQWLEQLDPLTRGSLFHQVQFELFNVLQEHQLLPMGADNLPQLLALADRSLDDVAERYREKLAPAIPQVWQSQIESLRSDLRGWIHSVVRADEAWRPAHFEMAFGLPDRAAGHPEAVVLDGKRLRGSIDLVEINRAGDRLRITDHKTGAAPRGGQLVIGGGEVLQPLLYALAAEAQLELPVESGRLFYCTRKGQYEVREVPLSDQNRQFISLVLEVIDKSLSDGLLVAAPRQDACKHCDYRSVCGPMEELRMRRKRPHQDPRLRALYTVRKSP